MAMNFAQAKTIDTDVIPVVDISALRLGGDTETVAKQLHTASQGLGFIYVKGHGIPDDAIQAARSRAYEFFHSQDARKADVIVSDKHRGWLRQGASKMQDDAIPDLKESFIWGYQDELGQTPADHALRGPNQWPAFVPTLQEAAMTYFHHAHDVAYHLMRAFARGLDLPENFFLQTCDKPLSRASFVYYPPQSKTNPEDISQGNAQTQYGVAPHTDFGVMTVLCQDDVGGLQVQDVNGDWLHAPPIEGTLVINVGDLLARWTNGSYKSTPHRVVNLSGKERLSLVLAFDPNPETSIDSRDIFGDNADSDHDAISCGDYLVWRFGKAFSYRNSATKD